jgi:hypothetical protein
MSSKMELSCKAVLKRDGDALWLFLDSALAVDLIGQRSTFAAEALNKDRDISSLSKYQCEGFGLSDLVLR